MLEGNATTFEVYAAVNLTASKGAKYLLFALELTRPKDASFSEAT